MEAENPFKLGKLVQLKPDLLPSCSGEIDAKLEPHRLARGYGKSVQFGEIGTKFEVQTLPVCSGEIGSNLVKFIYNTWRWHSNF